MADLMMLERHGPLDNAIWLLEYVSKTKGADHLKSAARNVSYVQYLCLDVVAFLVFVCYVCSKFAYYAHRAHFRIWRYAWGKSPKIKVSPGGARVAGKLKYH